MKIAQVAPLYEAVPPRLYGGTERVVAHLTDALVDLGHEVTLFASGEAQTKARLVPVRDQAIRLDPAPLKSDLAAHLTQLAEVRRRADQFDVIHFHTDMMHFPFFDGMAAKTVTTLHGRLDLKDLAGVYQRWTKFPPRLHQRRPAPAAARRQLGRDRASRDARRPLRLPAKGRWLPRFPRPDLAGEASGPRHRHRQAAWHAAEDRGQGRRRRRDLLRGEDRAVAARPADRFVGEIGDRRSRLPGGAEALLFPIDWPEPFGLVMIEAMACGTPVIAYAAARCRR
jgi:glycosyltransferase involved in cell wall biosynthesis